jgi:transposase
MSNALYIPIKESLKELRQTLKTTTLLFQPRIKLLIAMKKAGNSGISKRALVDELGVSGQSIHTWRTTYKNGGITALCSHKKVGFKPRIFTENEHLKIELKLKNPENGLRGFKELQEWAIKEFKKEIKYNTVLKYAIKHFGARVKVSRKYHVKKDQDAVTTFKKTLRKSVKRQSN